MKKVGYILILAVVLLAVYTLALAQFASQNPQYLSMTEASQEGS
jgi:hypothetical protein